jgi:hypothetical protein
VSSNAQYIKDFSLKKKGFPSKIGSVSFAVRREERAPERGARITFTPSVPPKVGTLASVRLALLNNPSVCVTYLISTARESSFVCMNLRGPAPGTCHKVKNGVGAICMINTLQLYNCLVYLWSVTQRLKRS